MTLEWLFEIDFSKVIYKILKGYLKIKISLFSLFDKHNKFL